MPQKLQEKLYKVTSWTEEKQAATRRIGLTLFRIALPLVRLFYGFCLLFSLFCSLVFVLYGSPGLALVNLVWAIVYGLIGYVMCSFCLAVSNCLRHAEIAATVRVNFPKDGAGSIVKR
jgi:hypothetical protein